MFDKLRSLPLQRRGAVKMLSLLHKNKFLMEELNVSRLTATSYLNQLESRGLVVKLKLWRENFYLNEKLFNLLISAFHLDIEKIDSIDSNG